MSLTTTEMCLPFLICFITAGETRSLNQDERDDFRYYNIGVLMASRLDSPFDLERCGPAVDLALEEVNDKFLAKYGIQLNKVQAR